MNLNWCSLIFYSTIKLNELKFPDNLRKLDKTIILMIFQVVNEEIRVVMEVL